MLFFYSCCTCFCSLVFYIGIMYCYMRLYKYSETIILVFILLRARLTEKKKFGGKGIDGYRSLSQFICFGHLFCSVVPLYCPDGG